MGYARGGSSRPLGTIDLSGTLRNHPEKSLISLENTGIYQINPLRASKTVRLYPGLNAGINEGIFEFDFRIYQQIEVKWAWIFLFFHLE